MSRFGVVVCAEISPPALAAPPCAPLSTRCASPLAASMSGEVRCTQGFEPYALLERYEPLVMAVAKQLRQRRHISLSHEDLVQSGRLTLVELASSPLATAINEAIVWTRLRNAMIDACRRQSWMGRRYRDDIPARQVALLSPERLEELPALTTLPDEPVPPTLHGMLRDAIATLPEQDQALILQHDLAQIPLTQLAPAARRSRSCMSRRRAQALVALRHVLEARGIHSVEDVL